MFLKIIKSRIKKNSYNKTSCLKLIEDNNLYECIKISHVLLYTHIKIGEIM